METKSQTVRHAVLDRDFSYEFYGKSTFPAGSKFNLGKGKRSYRLTNEGIVIVLGHGMNEIIPNDFFHIEETTTTTVTSKVVTTK